MTESDEADTRPSEPPAPTGTRRLRWWVAGITFVLGFVFGVLTVGLLNLGTPDFGAGSGAGTVGPSGAPTAGGTVPVVAEARVNAACLAVINHAQDVYSVLTGVEEAVADVDLQALDDIVRQLQPIEARLGRDLPQCQVDTEVVTNPTGPTTPSATPQPSASPTR